MVCENIGMGEILVYESHDIMVNEAREQVQGTCTRRTYHACDEPPIM